ncbi:MAG: hypothetical protein ACRDNB_09355 [Gaiellaceae bacterium]
MRRALVLVVLALAGCGGGDEEQSQPQPPASAGAPIPGGGLSIQEAIDSDLEGPLMVRGYLIERDGELRLCEAILESSPPQCGEPSLRVAGEAPEPSEERVSLLGEVENGTITVSETSKG